MIDYNLVKHDCPSCYFNNCGELQHIHHMIPKGWHQGPDEYWNLIGLCGSCHEKFRNLEDLNKNSISQITNRARNDGHLYIETVEKAHVFPACFL